MTALIAYRHGVTGEIQIVTSAAGMGVDWQVLPPPPADAGTRPYRYTAGAWVAAETGPRIARFDFVQLWPSAALPLVISTADPFMARAWASFQAWDGMIDLTDARVLAGLVRAEQLGYLTTAQADRIRAGLPPL
ncbi:hypothetical protein [Sandarakinorhabdus sp.]|uniref:hypothetical protein n=1 Tax=Sandarakinorhabdus sp. TaxID=1916663 RepID=UPI00286D9A6F|nr:hypothetical protein [Sandarakinorhabdus sp.]